MGESLYSGLCNFDRPDRGSHPINCVDWHQARAYCRSRGARLPSEAEWEYAARGPDGRTYPWGDALPSARLANVCDASCGALGWRLTGGPWPRMHDGDDGFGATAPAGSFPAGASPFGALDMAGNVAEWVDDGFERYMESDDRAPARVIANPHGAVTAAYRVVRGGGWHGHLVERARATYRWWDDASTRVSRIGFRCAR